MSQAPGPDHVTDAMRAEAHPKSSGLRGLYLVTPNESDDARMARRIAAVLPYAACLQYRNKHAGPGQRLEQASILRELCSDARVPLIVNDDPELASSVGADGVHLGEHDGAIAAARALLGHDALIGVSCYDRIELALAALAQGADYLAFGAFFPSPTKPVARRAGIELLERARALGRPLVAIGGITPDNARSVIAAGADMVAVISGVFDAPDPIAAARAYAACFS
jgi:thiamine-phosphate pyrophosphorylase